MSGQETTSEDFRTGFIRCTDCTIFVCVFRASLLRKLPEGYSGESCEKCQAWVCRLDKLPKEVFK